MERAVRSWGRGWHLGAWSWRPTCAAAQLPAWMRQVVQAAAQAGSWSQSRGWKAQRGGDQVRQWSGNLGRLEAPQPPSKVPGTPIFHAQGASRPVAPGPNPPPFSNPRSAASEVFSPLAPRPRYLKASCQGSLCALPLSVLPSAKPGGKPKSPQWFHLQVLSSHLVSKSSESAY